VPRQVAPRPAEPAEPEPARLSVADLVVAQQVLLPDGVEDEGRRLAAMHCQSCHLFPEPDLLTREVWERDILPRMGARLGMVAADPTCEPGVAAGDVDGDGDVDIVLGAFTALPGHVPERLVRTWESRRVPILLLENLLR